MRFSTWLELVRCHANLSKLLEINLKLGVTVDGYFDLQLAH